MPTVTTDVQEQIQELVKQVKALSDRIARLEGSAASPVPEPVAQAVAPKVEQPAPEAISEEILLVISAAVAAFLGERAHIRQVRLITSRTWATQGRVSIQASHHLANTHR